MSMILNVRHVEDRVNIDITDEAFLCIDSCDIEKDIPSGLKRHINFYLDRKLSYDECSEVLKKLESISGENGSISIFTSGLNFNDMMKAIGDGNSQCHYEMHIDDDKNIRNIIDSSNIICGLNFSRICCDCYFSERYLLNFNASEFDALCDISECKFDRDKLRQMRMIIEDVWNKLIPSHDWVDSFDQFSKIDLVLDYINFNNINDDYLKLFGDVSREDAEVMFANMLLDNYVARVNSYVAHGRNLLSDCDSIWLVTTLGDVDYGHSIVDNERFTDLEEKGYIDGKIKLEDKHKYRKDFVRNVNSYGCLDYDDYSNLKFVLEQKKKSMGNNVSSISGSVSSMPPLFPEGSDIPVISSIKKNTLKKMPLLFPNGKKKQ